MEYTVAYLVQRRPVDRDGAPLTEEWRVYGGLVFDKEEAEGEARDARVQTGFALTFVYQTRVVAVRLPVLNVEEIK